MVLIRCVVTLVYLCYGTVLSIKLTRQGDSNNSTCTQLCGELWVCNDRPLFTMETCKSTKLQVRQRENRSYENRSFSCNENTRHFMLFSEKKQKPGANIKHLDLQKQGELDTERQDERQKELEAENRRKQLEAEKQRVLEAENRKKQLKAEKQKELEAENRKKQLEAEKQKELEAENRKKQLKAEKQKELEAENRKKQLEAEKQKELEAENRRKQLEAEKQKELEAENRKKELKAEKKKQQKLQQDIRRKKIEEERNKRKLEQKQKKKTRPKHARTRPKHALMKNRNKKKKKTQTIKMVMDKRKDAKKREYSTGDIVRVRKAVLSFFSLYVGNDNYVSIWKKALTVQANSIAPEKSQRVRVVHVKRGDGSLSWYSNTERVQRALSKMNKRLPIDVNAKSPHKDFAAWVCTGVNFEKASKKAFQLNI